MSPQPEAEGAATRGGGGRRPAPGKVEAVAAAVAGPAFAASLVLLRDATILPPSIFDAVAAALVGVGLAPLAHRTRGAPFGTMTRGLGIAAGVLLLTPALVPPFDRAVPTIALWVLGAAILQANTHAQRERWTVAALGLAALATGAALALYLADAYPEPFRLRVAVVAASAAALLGLALRLAVRRSRWRALAPAPVGVLLVAAFTAIYLAYRGLVETQVDNLPLYEWTLAVAAAGLLLSRVRRTAHETATPEAWASDARRHAQDVVPVYDRRMAPYVAAIGRYLDTGMGVSEYRAAILRAAGAAPPAALVRALDAAEKARAGSPRGTRRGAQAAAAEARRAAHAAVMRAMNDTRGQPDGTPEPGVRAHS